MDVCMDFSYLWMFYLMFMEYLFLFKYVLADINPFVTTGDILYFSLICHK